MHELQSLIRNRLACGQLPLARAERLLRARNSGDGSTCSCCERMIGSAQIQFEIECLTMDGCWHALTAHIDCLEALRDASAKYPPRTAIGSSGKPRFSSLQVDAALLTLFHSWEQLCESYGQTLRIQHQRPSPPWPAQQPWRGLRWINDAHSLADGSRDEDL